jgi:hypothetical protein
LSELDAVPLTNPVVYSPVPIIRTFTFEGLLLLDKLIYSLETCLLISIGMKSDDALSGGPNSITDDDE